MTAVAQGIPAVVLVSGGLDSATTLAIARDRGFQCYALSFDYGQRHAAELASAARVAQRGGAVTHRTFTIDLSSFGGSALTDESLAVPTGDLGEPVSDDSIPITYVPARNTVFLALALAWAETLQARHIFIGANAVDYSGYPDCRPEFLDAFAAMANLATKIGVEAQGSDSGIQIEAPLVALSKAEIIRTGLALGVDYGETLSCYAPLPVTSAEQLTGDPSDKKEAADVLACGQCDSCRIRHQGFVDAGVADPTRYLT